MKCILISGYKGSGKDIVGDILKYRFDNVMMTSFAKKLKYICSKKYGLPIDYFYHYKDEYLVSPYECKPRDLLRIVGEWYRNVDKNYWVNAIVNEIEKYESKYPDGVVIITDYRFLNEYEVIKHRWETTRIHVDRGYHSDGHSSEQFLESDSVISNTGSINDLHYELNKIKF